MNKTQLHKLLKKRMPQKDMAEKFFTYLYLRNLQNLNTKTEFLRDNAGKHLEMFAKLYDDFFCNLYKY